MKLTKQQKYYKEYYSRPEVKARVKAYNHLPRVRARRKAKRHTSEFRTKHSNYMKSRRAKQRLEKRK